MKSYFNSAFFAGNRRRLREAFAGTAPIVITANGLLQRGADSAYAFSQDANFWYLTGIEEPDILLVMDHGKEYLIVPGRSASRAAFDGTPNETALSRRSGIKDIYDDVAGWKVLSSRLKRVKHIATVAPPPAYVERYGLYTNPARAALAEKLKGYNDRLELLDVGQDLARLRMIKQSPELKAIQQAIDITIATMKEIKRPSNLSKYAYEYEAEADFSRGFRRRGAAGHAFDPIVAGGGRACILHNVANNGQISTKELLLMDVGAEVEHYAADITRTVSLKAPTRRQRAVHAAVADVQQYAFGLLKPGVLIKEYEQQIENFMGEKLRELGLIKTINHKNVRKFYPHSTSHFLGLNVHDVGDYEKPLVSGVAMTVEPGIYIPKEGIGVRIEDDVLITKTGIKILTGKLLRDLA
jgi:Xaa-Pro aminopeptidase